MRLIMAKLITLHDAQAYYSITDILLLNVMLDEFEDSDQ